MTPVPHPALTYPCPFCHEGHPVTARLGGTPSGGTPIVACPKLANGLLHLVLGPPMFLVTGTPIVLGTGEK